MTSALINAPKSARRGEIFEVKTLISHPMETGFRHRASGLRVPRDIITTFTARYDGEVVFRAQLFPAIAANPFLTFHTVATTSGDIVLEWEGDNGFAARETIKITVT